MSTDELLHAIAYFSALEIPSEARLAAAQIPDWLDLVGVLRARDGAENLARALDAQRRVPQPGGAPIGTDHTAA